MGKLQQDEFDEKTALLDLLSALEYGTKKEEKDVIGPIFDRNKIPRLGKAKLAETIRKVPGFEPFFFAVLDAVRPFSLMVLEIYEFLSTTKTVTNRRASKFLVQFEEAKARMQFDLENFPKEVLKTLSEVEVIGSVVELQFPVVDARLPALEPDRTRAEVDWRAVSPRWDGDFYDDGFYMALSYSHTICDGRSRRHADRAEEIVLPILDRLKAICIFIDELLPTGKRFFGDSVRWYNRSAHPTDIVLKPMPSRFHVVRDPQTAAYVSHLVASLGSEEDSAFTGLDRILGVLRGFAISVNLWDNRHHREDRNHWLKKRLGREPSEVSPDAYLELLEALAHSYREKLDRIAPIVDVCSATTLVERALEFLALPFWKHRWYLYELWTLVRVLAVAKRRSTVELLNVESVDDVLEWKLPGGNAQTPVAMIGIAPGCIYCWSQRKTFHPGTGAGMEPDLRLTMSTPPYHDVFIVENKDRKTIRNRAIFELLHRYVGGSCADSVWLVNYEEFPTAATHLEKDWPARRVRLASRFRPRSLPSDFESDLESVLARYLAVEPRSSETLFIGAVTLSWKGPPRDLDLHAWIEWSRGKIRHISFRDTGSLNSEPFAELDNDQTQGHGQETIRTRGTDYQRVTIAVHNYSNEASLADSGATVTLGFGESIVALHPPANGTGRWWHTVALVRGRAVEGISRKDRLVVDVLHELTDEPYLPDDAEQ